VYKVMAGDSWQFYFELNSLASIDSRESYVIEVVNFLLAS